MVVLMGLHYASARLTGHDYEHPMTEHIQGRRPQKAWLILVVLLASLYATLSQAALAQRDVLREIQRRETNPSVLDGRRGRGLPVYVRELLVGRPVDLRRTRRQVTRCQLS